MKQVTLRNEDEDLEFKLEIAESWEELHLKDYFKMITQDKEAGEEESLIDMLEIISNLNKEELSNIPSSELLKISDMFNAFTNTKYDLVTHFKIDDVLYVVKKDVSNLTVSETIMIRNFQKSTDLTEIYLGIISIICREGYIKEEDGKIRYIQNKLDMEDIDRRKNIFRDKLKTSLALPMIEAFMSGTKK